MFCPNCGANVEGRFCAKCGTAVGAPADAPPPPGAHPYSAGAAGMTDNVAGALCYVLTIITGILFLVLAPYNRNKFVRFHAFQSIFFWVAWMLAWVAAGLLAVILPGFVMGIFWTLLPLVGFGIYILLIVKAYQNERFKLPIIGDLAEKQA